MRKRRKKADEAAGRAAGSGWAARTPVGTGSDATAGRKRGVVCVGEIAGAFGVRGEVRLKSYCERLKRSRTTRPWRPATGANSISWRAFGRARRCGAD